MLGDRLLYLQAPEPARRRRHRAPAHPQPTRLRRRPRGRHPRPRDRRPRSASSSATPGLTVDGISGPATLEAFRRVERMAGGSVAAVRERDELRRPAGSRAAASTSRSRSASTRSARRSRQGLERLRAQVMHDVSGADDHDLAARANRWDADLFLAVRAGDSTAWEVAWFETGDVPLGARLPRRARHRRTRSGRSAPASRSTTGRARLHGPARDPDGRGRLRRSPATTPAASRGRSRTRPSSARRSPTAPGGRSRRRGSRTRPPADARPVVDAGSAGDGLVDPLEVLEVRELDRDLAALGAHRDRRPACRGGRRADPRARRARAAAAPWSRPPASTPGAGLAPRCDRARGPPARPPAPTSPHATACAASRSWSARSGRAEQGAGVAHRERAVADQALDRRRELEQPERVGDRGPAPADPGRHLLVGEARSPR